MPEVDPLQKSRELGLRIDALRAEASSIRTANYQTHLARENELGVERDRLTRQKAGLRKSVEEAEFQANRAGQARQQARRGRQVR